MARSRKKTGKKKAVRKELARKSAMKKKSAQAGPSRRKNILAGSSNVRIKGHMRGAHRRAQGRRDAKRGGG